MNSSLTKCLSRVGVGLSLAVHQGDVNKSSGVQQSLVSSSFRLLWLFSLVDLWSLRFNLTGTSQGSVDFTLKQLVTICLKMWHIDFQVLLN